LLNIHEIVLHNEKFKQVSKVIWQKAASHGVPLSRRELSLLLRTPQQRLPMLFELPEQPPKYCQFPWGISTFI